MTFTICLFIRFVGLFERKFLFFAGKYFTKTEEFLLKAQAVDSSRSITANIAEGFGRFHYLENIQFCRTSRGSLGETPEHLITVYDEKYITKDFLSEINREFKECLKQTNGYIK